MSREKWMWLEHPFILVSPEGGKIYRVSGTCTIRVAFWQCFSGERASYDCNVDPSAFQWLWLQSTVVRNIPINICHRGGIQSAVVESALKEQLHYSCVDRGLVFQLKGMNSQKGKGELTNSFGFLVVCCFCWFLVWAVIWGFWGLCKVPFFQFKLKKFELGMNPNLIPENLTLKGSARLDLHSSFIRAFL